MKLVLGTVQFGLNYGINNSLGKPSLENAFAILDRASQLGIDELDTADAYGDSAEVLSSYFKQSPQKKFKVMSKFIGDDKSSYSASLEKSCQRLGLDFLDGYYFHRFEDFKKFDEFSRVRELKASGKLKNLAVSLYSLDDLQLAVHSKEVDLIQLPFSIFDRSEEKINLLIEAKKNKKSIYVRSVFLQGLFFKDLNLLPPKLLPLKGALVELHRLVGSYKVNMEDLCLNFAVQQDYIDKVVIGVDTVAQLESNVGSIKNPLPAELIKEVLSIKISSPELLNPVNWNS
jgi:aryl-alcohol dehydrogenase-like predicted oxidoreductase